ncbi:TlyA family RNA methyltransferase [Oscillospiraceae bacterium OttesenSCG-928-G22]|nr:TlyA family RNA methyltransferase [Oscillospiraceae bacterium OttesenSCG-928-G22]
MSEKKRIDLLLFEKGLTPSRERAKTSVMSGLVFVDGVRVDKPGTAVPVDARIEVKGPELPFVSRGGLKLEKALDRFGIDVAGFACADVGASTGGFTDCLLKRGAARVYAIDVGYGQLAWNLRNDPRVTVMERTNIRLLEPEAIPEKLSFASIDVSFISLRLVLPPVSALLLPGAEVVCLVKPQFEAGRGKVGKKGVVRDPAVHVDVLDNFLRDADTAGFCVKDLTFSPITGPEGNIEFLAHLARGESAPIDIRAVVDDAHRSLSPEK